MKYVGLIIIAEDIFVFCNFQAMKLIPEEWSIGVISQFLSGSVRLSLHKSRKTKILRSLARGENIKASLYCKIHLANDLVHFLTHSAYHEERASH